MKKIKENLKIIQFINTMEIVQLIVNSSLDLQTAIKATINLINDNYVKTQLINIINSLKDLEQFDKVLNRSFKDIPEANLFCKLISETYIAGSSYDEVFDSLKIFKEQIYEDILKTTKSLTLKSIILTTTIAIPIILFNIVYPIVNIITSKF